MAISLRKSRRAVALALVAALYFASGPSLAQMTEIDPDAMIDGDLAGEAPAAEAPAVPAASTPAPAEVPGSAADAKDAAWIDISPDPAGDSWEADETSAQPGELAGELPPVETAAEPVSQAEASVPAAQETVASANPSDTYAKDDLIGAAEGVFGKGSQGLAMAIEDILKKQGEPNGYIVGREGGGAFAVGLRYGSGTLHHKVEGNRPVYWTGPSLGFDLGANAAKAFVLVYNLYDTQELYKRFGAGEGQAYLVGGFNVSYLRRGDIVLIPVRMGAGLRLGANVGYMKFTEKQKWMPF